MTDFEYESYITVIENERHPIVTLQDETLKSEYGKPFASLCVKLLLLDNAISALESARTTDLKKNIQFTWTKIQLGWYSRKLGIEDFKAKSLLEAVYEKRKQLQT